MKPLFSFSVLSDLHFMAYKDTDLPVEWVPFLQREIQFVNSLKPSFIVINGDLTNGKERDYKLAASTMQQVKMPVFYTMGNHEYYGIYEEHSFTNEIAHQRFLDYTGCPSIYYEKIIHGFTFLFLATENYTTGGNEAGWISAAQLNWLQERLKLSYKKPVFVFLHHPVNKTVAESDHTCMQSNELRKIFSKHPGVLLFSGHTHCRMDRNDQFIKEEGIIFIGGGCLYQEVPQSRWVDVYENYAVIRLINHKDRKWLDDFQETINFNYYHIQENE